MGMIKFSGGAKDTKDPTRPKVKCSPLEQSTELTHSPLLFPRGSLLWICSILRFRSFARKHVRPKYK